MPPWAPQLPSEIGTPGSQRLTSSPPTLAHVLACSRLLWPVPVLWCLLYASLSNPSTHRLCPSDSNQDPLLIWPPYLLPATLKHPKLDKEVSASPYPASGNYPWPPTSALSSHCPVGGPRTLL